MSFWHIVIPAALDNQAKRDGCLFGACERVGVNTEKFSSKKISYPKRRLSPKRKISLGGIRQLGDATIRHTFLFVLQAHRAYPLPQFDLDQAQ